MTETKDLIKSQQCQCKTSLKWFVQRWGQDGFTILCSDCGKNATTEAQKLFGINAKDDSYDMAKNHLELVHYAITRE